MSAINPANKPTWIEEGERFSLLTIDVKFDGDIPITELAPGVWGWTGTHLNMPSHWADWIGKSQCERIESSSLCIVAKMKSDRANIINDDSLKLSSIIDKVYSGLLLSGYFAPSHEPFRLEGYCLDGEISVRQLTEMPVPQFSISHAYKAMTPANVINAIQIASALTSLNATMPNQEAWRLRRVLYLYSEARTRLQPLDRIHQYCRVLEGLVATGPGNGKKDFSERTQIFIGSRDRNLMGDIYTMRGDIEHLREHKYLASFNREARLDIIKKEAVIEFVARETLAHILKHPFLWHHFGSLKGIQDFWAKSQAEQKAIWGAPQFKPSDALVGYDPDLIQDHELGLFDAA